MPDIDIVDDRRPCSAHEFRPRPELKLKLRSLTYRLRLSSALRSLLSQIRSLSATWIRKAALPAAQGSQLHSDATFRVPGQCGGSPAATSHFGSGGYALGQRRHLLGYSHQVQGHEQPAEAVAPTPGVPAWLKVANVNEHLEHHRALVWLGGLTGRPPEGKERCGILHCILASVAAPREKSDFSHFSLAGLLEHAAANALLEQ